VTSPRVNTNSLKAVYGDGAMSYDELWHPVIRPPALALIRALGLENASRVLDVGTGALTAPLRAVAPRAVIVSVDASAAMLHVARAHAQATACLADASRLPFPRASVDAVLLAYVLFHLLDPGAGAHEAARVLRSGGSAGTVTWASETQPNAATVWDDTLGEFGVPTLPDHGNHTGLDTEDHVRALLATNGLTPTRAWREPIEHAFTPEIYLRLRSGGGSSRARLARVDAHTAGAAIAEARQRLRALDPSDFVFRGEVICTISHKPS